MQTKKDYTDLDAEILAHIWAGFVTFAHLCGALREMAKPYRTDTRDGRVDMVIDRRLQSLRKAGKIVYTNRWKVTT